MLYNEKLTYRELYQWGLDELAKAGGTEAELDARLLLEWCCGTDRNTLLVHGERKISVEEYDKYTEGIARRKEHMPLQYITGEQDFMGLTFIVNRHVLIPRQDTEVLVEEAMRYLHDGMRLLDLCTGSGCILLSLLRYSNDCTGVGADISGEALQVAHQNMVNLLERNHPEADLMDRCMASSLAADEESGTQSGGIQENGQRVNWVQSDLFEQIDQNEKFDMIVSNPPYIRTDVLETLMPEVKEYEPRLALDGQGDGLFYYRKIIAQADGYLTGGGMLFFEIGYDQGRQVRCLMEEAGYKEVKIVKDFAGLDRVVHGVYIK